VGTYDDNDSKRDKEGKGILKSIFRTKKQTQPVKRKRKIPMQMLARCELRAKRLKIMKPVDRHWQLGLAAPHASITAKKKIIWSDANEETQSKASPETEDGSDVCPLALPLTRGLRDCR
jgi:hypothetical protein